MGTIFSYLLVTWVELWYSVRMSTQPWQVLQRRFSDV
jgi:hypothetical protein